ncbi:hypothetical protein QBC36DRAFT_308931 [Triangularia setosa]|uniref:Uncharacterized protein n=1 Tax=Triangularia setosa TaxID=2587417 RepID=A0AAN6WB23_9PEZI|nr:hypothetical protein QBC36DRAFT_308931 [Podospora setosa]
MSLGQLVAPSRREIYLTHLQNLRQLQHDCRQRSRRLEQMIASAQHFFDWENTTTREPQTVIDTRSSRVNLDDGPDEDAHSEWGHKSDFSGPSEDDDGFYMVTYPADSRLISNLPRIPCLLGWDYFLRGTRKTIVVVMWPYYLVMGIGFMVPVLKPGSPTTTPAPPDDNNNNNSKQNKKKKEDECQDWMDLWLRSYWGRKVPVSDSADSSFGHRFLFAGHDMMDVQSPERRQAERLLTTTPGPEPRLLREFTSLYGPVLLVHLQQLVELREPIESQQQVPPTSAGPDRHASTSEQPVSEAPENNTLSLGPHTARPSILGLPPTTDHATPAPALAVPEPWADWDGLGSSDLDFWAKLVSLTEDDDEVDTDSNYDLEDFEDPNDFYTDPADPDILSHFPTLSRSLLPRYIRKRLYQNRDHFDANHTVELNDDCDTTMNCTVCQEQIDDGYDNPFLNNSWKHDQTDDK